MSLLPQAGLVMIDCNLIVPLVSRIHRAESSANEGVRLRRLAELFDKHPDVREILELVRDLGIL